MGLDIAIPEYSTVAYSANFGGGEPIQTFPTIHRIHTVLFTDQPPPYPACWKRVVRVEYETLAGTPRRAARRLKLQSHLLFPKAQWSVWFDATHSPVVDLSELHVPLLYSSVACFRHPRRRTIREEAATCIEQQLDTPERINQMCAFFDTLGFQDNYGLYGTACLVRRHTPQVACMNSLWWEYVSRWSHRDQISLPCVLWQAGIAPACLLGEPRPRQPVFGEPSRPNPYFDVTLWPDP